VTVLDAGKVQHKIRLTGIDAPEKAEPFGQRAKQNLSIWVFGKKVLVETDKLDRYGRTLGKVMVNGFDANLEQVKAGFAWHFKAYEREQPAEDRQVYPRVEAVARCSGACMARCGSDITLALAQPQAQAAGGLKPWIAEHFAARNNLLKLAWILGLRYGRWLPISRPR